MPDLRKGYWVQLLPCERTDGTLSIAFIARRTYAISTESNVIQPLEDDAQPPFYLEDRCDEGDAETAPPTVEMEMAPEKARTDVIVVGKAFAPGGKALKEFDCGIRIGDRLKKLRILGPRKAIYVPPKKIKDKPDEIQPPRFSEPEPIKDLPLSYTLAYGGKSWLVPDDETLKMQKIVNGQVDKEKAEVVEKNAAAEGVKKAAAEKKEKETKEKALFEALGKKAPKDETLKYGDGSEGFDDEGVRLWGASASKDGTAVLDLEELDKQQLADEAAAMRRKQEEEEAAIAVKANEKPKKRRNLQGEALEVDDKVEVLTEEALAVEMAKSAAEQAERQKELAEASKKRSREQVEQNDGTKVMEAMGDDVAPEDIWEKQLKDGFVDTDAVAIAERKKRIAQRKKDEEAALAEFPQLPCPTNAFGKGFCVSNHEAVVNRLELPQIEDPDVPLTPRDLIQDVMALDKVPLPAGFSTYPRSARPRVEKMGTYPSGLKDWDKFIEAEKRKLDLSKQDDVRLLRELEKMNKPTVIQPAYFNCASPLMQLTSLVGDEEVMLTNLTKSGQLFFKLPGKVVEAELDRGNGIERRDLKLDTLLIEPDANTVTILWRTQFPLGSWEEMAQYPHLVGWVLDLDVAERKNRDWADRLKKSQGDGTAIMDISEIPLELEPYLDAKPVEVKPKKADDALDLDREGTYRLVNQADWEVEAAAGTIDVKGEEKKRNEEEAYVAEKTAAIKALEAEEKKEAERRTEIATAVAAQQPIPPKDGPPPKGGKPPPPPPARAAPKPMAKKK